MTMDSDERDLQKLTKALDKVFKANNVTTEDACHGIVHLAARDFKERDFTFKNFKNWMLTILEDCEDEWDAIGNG